MAINKIIFKLLNEVLAHLPYQNWKYRSWFNVLKMLKKFLFLCKFDEDKFHTDINNLTINLYTD